VVEESKLERVNAQKRIDVLGIMKMLISVAETNAHHGLNGAIIVPVRNPVVVV
jgi:hypothetical protein